MSNVDVDKKGLDQAIGQVLDRHVAECRKLVSVERLSGGASQETYRIRIETDNGEKLLAMRRAAGGVKVEPLPGHPGLDVDEEQQVVAAQHGGVDGREETVGGRTLTVIHRVGLALVHAALPADIGKTYSPPRSVAAQWA